LPITALHPTTNSPYALAAITHICLQQTHPPPPPAAKFAKDCLLITSAD